jgi:phage terminase large subunit-like protein
MTASPAEYLADLPEAERELLLDGIGPDEAALLLQEWSFWARAEQRPPDWNWRWWAVITGRGWGKNRTGAEWVLDRSEQFAAHGHRHQVAMVNRTFGHVRSLQLNGESGLAVCADRRGHRIDHGPSVNEKVLLIKQPGGREHRSTVEMHSALGPDEIRGRNLHTVHADEVAAWRQKVDAEGGTSFINLDLALRAECPPGLSPQGMVTTTPRPIPLIRDLISGVYGPTAVTRGSLFDNQKNLAAAFVSAVIARYAGTRLGAQEIEGVVLDDVYGALWTYAIIEDHRIDSPGMLDRIVVGVDPPGGKVTECGIVVAGRHAEVPVDRLRHADVIEDVSQSGPPEIWARTVVDAYHRHRADAVIAERNFGEEMVRAVIHNVDPSVRIIGVRASETKRARAEPVALMYDSGRIHHVGVLPGLEDELLSWVPPGTIDEWGVERGSTESPNRLDALVWAISHLLPYAGVMTAEVVNPNRQAEAITWSAFPGSTGRTGIDNWGARR